MPPIRTLTTPNDFGPATVTRTRISRTGVGSRLIVRGNPYSFTADWLTPCLPFASLAGGRSAQSQAVRQQQLLGNLSNDPAAAGSTPGTGAPAAASPTAAGSGGGGTGTTPGPAPSTPPPASGPFGYIGIAKPGGK